VKAERMRACIL